MTAKAVQSQEILDQHLQFISEGRWGELEECWLEQLARIPSSNEFFKPWLLAMKRADALGRAEALMGLLVEDALDRGKFKDALRFLLIVLPTFPKSEPLRPLLIRALSCQYAGLEQLDQFIRLAGFEDGGSLVTAYKAFRDWTRLAPGQVYQHHSWGEGIVQQLDPAAGKVTLSFPDEPEKVMTVEGVSRYLMWIDPRHFLALRTKEPETLQAMAEDRPVALVKLILSSREDHLIRQSDLKALLLGSVIGEKQWTGWWGRTREELAVDAFVDFDRSGGAHAQIGLRDKPRTFAQEIEDGFFDSEVGVGGRVELIRQLAHRPKDANLPQELVKRIAKRLREEWDLAADATPARRLEVAYMIEDLAQAVPGIAIDVPDSSEILESIENYRELIEINHHDYGARALVALIERDGEEGVHQAARLLPEAPVKLAQAIWETMEKEHHADQGVQALQALFDRPLDNPDTFAWALRATLDGSWQHLEDYFPAQAMIPELIEQVDQWHSIAEDVSRPRELREAARKLLSRGRTLLSADHCELISLAVEGMTRDLANRLRRQIQANPAFNSAFKAQAERAITVTRRDLEEPAVENMMADPASDGVFNCTAKAQTKAMAELREITSVLIPKNSKVIEEARMEGDLRENAGYQYAKEEQKMLVQKQATLSDLLSRARIIRPEDTDISRIGFGTRFTVRNLDNDQDETYTLVGRWEADPERNYLSEQAPIARQFAGRTAGEKLRIQRPGAPATNYEVLKIENALMDNEWQMTEG